MADLPNIPGAAPILVSESVAARLLSVSPRSVFGLCKSGRLAYVKIGRRKLIDRRDLEAFVARTKIGGGQ